MRRILNLNKHAWQTIRIHTKAPYRALYSSLFFHSSLQFCYYSLFIQKSRQKPNAYMAILNEYENLISVHTFSKPSNMKCFNLLKIEISKIPLAQKRMKLKLKRKSRYLDLCYKIYKRVLYCY